MSGKAIAVKKYVVKLSEDELNQLHEIIRKVKSSAQRLIKARILLKADVSEAGEGWSDSRIIKALETSATTVYRTRANSWWKRALRPFSAARNEPGPRCRRFLTVRRKLD